MYEISSYRKYYVSVYSSVVGMEQIRVELECILCVVKRTVCVGKTLNG